MTISQTCVDSDGNYYKLQQVNQLGCAGCSAENNRDLCRQLGDCSTEREVYVWLREERPASACIKCGCTSMENCNMMGCFYLEGCNHNVTTTLSTPARVDFTKAVNYVRGLKGAPSRQSAANRTLDLCRIAAKNAGVLL